MAELSLEAEQFIDALIAAGRFQTRSDVLDEAVRLLREELPANGREHDVQSAYEWCERFQAWAAGHGPLPHEADDSRESIYAGRGE
jgi:Arc/MetJ-type ribon-helix-helix transcriptional regulator